MISEFAKTIIFSHHTHKGNYVYPSNVIKKGAIQQFTKNSVIFTDGSAEEITDIVFCTGESIEIPMTFKKYYAFVIEMIFSFKIIIDLRLRIHDSIS